MDAADVTNVARQSALGLGVSGRTAQMLSKCMNSSLFVWFRWFHPGQTGSNVSANYKVSVWKDRHA